MHICTLTGVMLEFSSQKHFFVGLLNTSCSTRPSCRRVPSPMVKLRKLQSHLDFDQLAKNELELKANMYFHIGNPIKRWRVEKVVPIKLLLQLLKTFCVITQVCVCVCVCMLVCMCACVCV